MSSEGIRLPSQLELQRVTDLITGGQVPYASLQPEQKVQVINIAVQADIADSFAMITADTQHISRWFELSRLWEGA